MCSGGGHPCLLRRLIGWLAACPLPACPCEIGSVDLGERALLLGVVDEYPSPALGARGAGCLQRQGEAFAQHLALHRCVEVEPQPHRSGRRQEFVGGQIQGHRPAFGRGGCTVRMYSAIVARRCSIRHFGFEESGPCYTLVQHHGRPRRWPAHETRGARNDQSVLTRWPCRRHHRWRDGHWSRRRARTGRTRRRRRAGGPPARPAGVDGQGSAGIGASRVGRAHRRHQHGRRASN